MMAERHHTPPRQGGRPSRKQLSTWSYSIAWFCATEEEGEVARACLDERHAPPSLHAYSNTNHVYGQINGIHTSHNIIIVRPVASGKANMANAVAHLRQNFPNITASFFVGIAGALPFQSRADDRANSIERGDVVVAQSLNGEPAVIQYDYAGHYGLADFRPKHRADKTADSLQSLFDRWWEDYKDGETDAQDILDQLIAKKPEFAAPEPESDVLFRADQKHVDNNPNCIPCMAYYKGYRSRTGKKSGSSYLVKVHRGMVLTGDSLIKNADMRSAIKAQSDFRNALCVDMESAVLMDNWHPLVIRGISDYADSHYGRDWTHYAAAAAAAVAKDMIMQLQRDNVNLLASAIPHSVPTSITRTEQIIFSTQDNEMISAKPFGQDEASELTEFRSLDLFSSSIRHQHTEDNKADTINLLSCHSSQTSGIVRQEQVRDLGSALMKLGKLSTRLRGQVYGQPAFKIAKHLASTVACLRTFSPGTRLLNHSEDQWNILRRSLEECGQVAINTIPRRFRRGTVVRIDRRLDCYEFREGKLTLITSAQHSRDESRSEVIQTLSVLRFQPSANRAGSPLVAYFGGQIDDFQRSLIHPTIFTYRTISSSSKVFELIGDDDLNGFRRLLASQEATTRDCDEIGASLLQYACYFASPKCCKFLIESGADVNRREPNLINEHNDVSLLDAFAANDEEASEERLCRSLICRRLLLEADADPVLDTTSTDGSIWYRILTAGNKAGSTASLENLIRYVNEYYIDWQELTVNGDNIWLWACGRAGPLSTPRILDVLARAGCNTAKVDERGWNCLFYCVLNASWPDGSKELEALIQILKQHFHDIHAKDRRGMTIFDHVRAVSDYLGSYRRDLLLEGLFRAGYVGERPCIRRAVYTKGYLPEHHLAMRHLHSWSIWQGGLLKQLRSSDVDHLSVGREAMQIMARLRLFQEKASRTKGLLVKVPGVRVGWVRSRVYRRVFRWMYRWIYTRVNKWGYGWVYTRVYRPMYRRVYSEVVVLKGMFHSVRGESGERKGGHRRFFRTVRIRFMKRLQWTM